MSPEKTLKRFLESAKLGKKERARKYQTKTSQSKEVDLSRLSILYNDFDKIECLDVTYIYNGVMCDLKFKIKDSLYKVRLVKEKVALKADLGGNWGVNPHSFKAL